MKKQTVIISLATLVALLGISALTYYAMAKKPELAGALLPLKPVRVTVVRPTQAHVKDTVSISGHAEPEERVSVYSKLNDLPISKVLVKSGDRVREGQLLAQLDAEEMRIRLRQLQELIAQAEENLLDADDSRQPANEGANAGQLSSGDRSMRAEAAMQASRLQLDRYREDLADLQMRIGYQYVVAPVGGIVAALNAAEGERSIPGSALFTVDRLDRAKLTAETADWRVAGLGPQTPVIAISETQPGQSFSARLLAVESLPGSPERYRVVVDVDPQGSLTPGVPLTAVFETGGEHAGMLVPLGAIGKTGDSPDWKVLVLSGTKSVSVRSVAPGAVSEGMVEIAQGIGADDRIVSIWNEVLAKDGAKVEIVNE